MVATTIGATYPSYARAPARACNALVTPSHLGVVPVFVIFGINRRITASDGAVEDYFGFSVSVSGDAAIVGARSDNDNGSGSAYIYRWNGVSWLEENRANRMKDVNTSAHRPNYRVFLSSTYRDNKERREKIWSAILRADMQPIGMELFAADERPVKDACLDEVQRADVYLGVIAWRYGWIPEGEDKSITELEYARAKELGKDRMMLLLAEDVKVDPSTDFDEGADRWEKQKSLEAFKRQVAGDQMATPFRDDDLGVPVLHALTVTLSASRGRSRSNRTRRQSAKV